MTVALPHNKYEELVCETIKDVLTQPAYIHQHFLNGEWTASITGRPYHNVALDESHEQVVNKRLEGAHMPSIRTSHCSLGKLHGILGQVHAAHIIQCIQA